MRPLLIILSVFFCISASGNPVYKKLCEVNKCWTEQKDINHALLPAGLDLSEREWIRLHLSLVEQTLRSRSTLHLTPEQRKNRNRSLDHLHEYWVAGAFPINDDYSYRTPIFIDKHDNFCAVGYLVKASGYEHVSRMIASKTNLAYVRQMNYPQLLAWADKYGFTVDELAWIQPAYWSPHYLTHMGKGTDGEVNELYADTATQRLYVGGSFANVDSTITANNIAYVTESNGTYTWHSIGTGTNGPVYAVEKYGSNIFVGGSFTSAGGTSVNNIAYWNGSTWQSAGCLNGTVKDLIVFNGNLYVSGQFGVCSPSTQVGFAKWTGSGWQTITGLTGKVNTMEVRDTFLLLGGAFTYNGNAVNAIKWNPNVGFQTFGNIVRNEVNDFVVYKDTVYAACRHTAVGDTTLLKKLYGNTWDSVSASYFKSQNGLTYNALYGVADTFLLGGDFNNFYVSMGYMIANCISMSNSVGFHFGTSGAINKMITFKNRIIVGGEFKSGNLKGIGKAVYYNPPYNINVHAFAQPACKNANGKANAITAFGYGPYKYLWSNGDTTQSINNLIPGTYSVIVTDYWGKKGFDTVIVKGLVIDKTLLHTDSVLMVKTFGDKYQWINCEDGTILPGDTSHTVTIKTNGSYAAIIEKDSCIDTTDCYFVNVTSVRDVNGQHATIYPNPVKDEINIRFNSRIQKADVIITDVSGRKLFSRYIYDTDFVRIDMQGFAKGLYILNIERDNGDLIKYKITKD